MTKERGKFSRCREGERDMHQYFGYSVCFLFVVVVVVQKCEDLSLCLFFSMSE